jgi:excinuclease UvrABC helicase subunit UvrB
MANTLARLGNRPALILCHNKTLAAQLARELRSLLQKNQVHLFVSYYNHYVPESYNEKIGKFTSKKSAISKELNALRHMATKALVQHSDTVIVASISCIYGLGLPSSYLDAAFTWQVGESNRYSEDEIIATLQGGDVYLHIEYDRRAVVVVVFEEYYRYKTWRISYITIVLWGGFRRF